MTASYQLWMAMTLGMAVIWSAPYTKHFVGLAYRSRIGFVSAIFTGNLNSFITKPIPEIFQELLGLGGIALSFWEFVKMFGNI